MKYHISFPSVYYGVLYFGCIFKDNHVVFFKKNKELQTSQGYILSRFKNKTIHQVLGESVWP